MSAGHQAATGGGTDRRPRIALGKTHTPLCQFIYIRGLEFFLSVTTQVTVAKIVCEDKNDICFLLSYQGDSAAACSEQAETVK